jgi:hypothetical protein
MSGGTDRAESRIAALMPRGSGHQFMLYGDACSGVPGAPHEGTFARVNAVIRRLAPAPDFIVFTGDEIAGLVPDEPRLRAQWRHWFEHEMAWLDRRATPIWHATSNHATYDAMSEIVFADVLGMPRNGPAGQEGLSYWVRHGDLLLVFVHTAWSGLGGEGHVETAWLREVLRQHPDARHKLVVGHHPVHPINGFSGAYQREIGPEHADEFWTILVDAGVLAYVCGHILAFDVQVHRGVLQICTAGAGTAHRMPADIEYLHCVQAALDGDGLRYQVLDDGGAPRERLEWPLAEPAAENWRRLPAGESPAPLTGRSAPGRTVMLRVTGRAAPSGTAAAQTVLSAFAPDSLAPVWIGVHGPRQVLAASIGRGPGRSPHQWLGPALEPGRRFALDLLIHPDMGPGGVLCRRAAREPWSSLAAASATGPERLEWPARWSVGHAQGGAGDRPFLGSDLTVSIAVG